MKIEQKIIRQIKRNIADEQEEKGLFDLPEENDITKKINSLQGGPPEFLAQLFSVEVAEFTHVDWDEIHRTLREEILVKYEPGKGLIDDSEEYDKQWFSKVKITDKYDQYYSDRFSECYKEKLGPQVRYTLSRDTESILNLCGSPDRETVKFNRVKHSTILVSQTQRLEPAMI
jgi:hypothetical protein